MQNDDVEQRTFRLIFWKQNPTTVPVPEKKQKKVSPTELLLVVVNEKKKDMFPSTMAIKSWSGICTPFSRGASGIRQY